MAGLVFVVVAVFLFMTMIIEACACVCACVSSTALPDWLQVGCSAAHVLKIYLLRDECRSSSFQHEPAAVLFPFYENPHHGRGSWLAVSDSLEVSGNKPFYIC